MLITEAVLLAMISAAASVPLTAATLWGVGAMLPSYAVSTFAFQLDIRTLAAAMAFGLVVETIFGLAPAVSLVRSSPGQVLRMEGARATGGKAAARLLSGLATTQVALSMALLVLAGWFARAC